MFYFDKLVIVKRFSEALGQYNRPQRTCNEIGQYKCTYTASEDNTNQLQPQKDTRTRGTLYTDRDADIIMGDVLYIYDLDEYDEPIMSTEYKVLADKPYRKRTHMETQYTVDEEV